MQKKALLFINGQAPEQLPSPEGYDLIACTDGAFHYLEAQGFPLEKLDFISGDFDSHQGFVNSELELEFILTPDQDKTDFEKAMELLLQKKCTVVDVYGGSGGEMDHYLGNLHVASKFVHLVEIHFYDAFAHYFFAPKKLILPQVQGKIISLFPFPLAKNIRTQGLQWELNGQDMEITQNMGIRNLAIVPEVKIQHDSGNLIVFVRK